MAANFDALRRGFSEVLEPLECFRALTNGGRQAYCQLLESSEPGLNGKQQSLLLLGHALKITGRGFKVSIKALNNNGQDALAIIAQQFDAELIESSTLTELQVKYPDTRDEPNEQLRLTRLTPLDAIRQSLQILSGEQTELAEQLIAAGVAGYEVMDAFETLPTIDLATSDISEENKQSSFSDFVYLIADSYLLINQQNYRNELRQIVFNGEHQQQSLATARHNMQAIYSKLQSLSHDQVAPVVNTTNSMTEQQYQQFIEQQVTITPDVPAFSKQVDQVKQAIAKGRVFQAVISREFTLDCNNPLLAYQYLRAQNPSPYQFYCQLGDYTLIGASPESSLRYQASSRAIHLMPIAGTRPRGKTSTGAFDHELDARLEVELKLDEKELAEHMMLVDLARNDLARIAKAGTRKVTELMGIYRYSAVMHLVSRVEAELADNLDIYHACQACFHMGTLTGAPKVEAMRLIRELEQRRRGAYGGAVGYFNGAGDMDSAIIIRSALIHNNKATVTAGAGIVADSTAPAEVQETLNKARSVLTALAVSGATLGAGANS